MDPLALFVLALIVGVIFYLARRQPAEEMICTDCGFQGRPVVRYRGTVAIEIVLWLALLLPGLIYSLWRLTTRHAACPRCGHAAMIPLATPRGQQLRDQFAPKKS